MGHLASLLASIDRLGARSLDHVGVVVDDLEAAIAFVVDDLDAMIDVQALHDLDVPGGVIRCFVSTGRVLPYSRPRSWARTCAAPSSASTSSDAHARRLKALQPASA